jgi:hypothetical protein
MVKSLFTICVIWIALDDFFLLQTVAASRAIARRKHSFRFSLDAVVSSRDLDIRAPLSGEIFVTRDRDARRSSRRLSSRVAGLVPATRVFLNHSLGGKKTWMAGSSPLLSG